MRLFFCSLLIFGGIIGCGKSTAPDSTAAAVDKQDASTPTFEGRKDNTGVNKRDRVETAKTPLDQNENKKDIDITATIRKRVMNEKISTNAHNSKIITQDGKVTLRGPVASAEEKDQIEKIALDVAGEGNVDNQLEIQP